MRKLGLVLILAGSALIAYALGWHPAGGFSFGGSAVLNGWAAQGNVAFGFAAPQHEEPVKKGYQDV